MTQTTPATIRVVRIDNDKNGEQIKILPQLQDNNNYDDESNERFAHMQLEDVDIESASIESDYSESSSSSLF